MSAQTSRRSDWESPVASIGSFEPEERPQRSTSARDRSRSSGEAIGTAATSRDRAEHEGEHHAEPTRRRKSRETPRASTSFSPTFRRVRKVDDMPARFRSRNSIRLKRVPTATISSAPFS